MKVSLRNLPLLAALVCNQTYAQEVRMPPASTVAAIPKSFQPTPTAPAPVQETPHFEIESTQIKLIEVVEAPPMAGLPPVEGTMTLKVHTVADPGIVQPNPPVAQSQNQVSGKIPDTSDSPFDSRLSIVSATVYDRSRTLLTFNTDDGVVSVWSNIDFNHFSGVASFEAKGAVGKVRSHNLIMTIGNETTARLGDSGKSVIPAIPDGAPAFVIQSGVKPDAATLTLIEDLHALYRAEGSNMAKAALAREKELAEQKADLLANPPKPKDVTVNFWKRDTGAEEGGQP